jgi:hypothetical protein
VASTTAISDEQSYRAQLPMKETEIEKAKFGSSGYGNELAIYQTLRLHPCFSPDDDDENRIVFRKKIGSFFPLQM